jgi:hypothetical protein
VQRTAVFSCLLIHEYASPTGKFSDEEIEKLYVAELNTEVSGFIDSISDKIKTKGLEMKRFEFFLLPVPSVQGFRDRFQSKIGWPA